MVDACRVDSVRCCHPTRLAQRLVKVHQLATMAATTRADMQVGASPRCAARVAHDAQPLPSSYALTRPDFGGRIQMRHVDRETIAGNRYPVATSR